MVSKGHIPIVGGPLDGSILYFDASHLISDAVVLDGQTYDLARDVTTKRPLALYGKSNG